MTSIMASLFAAGFQLKDKKTEADEEAELDQVDFETLMEEIRVS